MKSTFSAPDKNGTVTETYWELCSRCGGTGIVKPYGTCFSCMGEKGKYRTRKIFTKEHRAKLDQRKEQKRLRDNKKEMEQFGLSQGFLYISDELNVDKSLYKDNGFRWDRVLKCWYSLNDSNDFNTIKVSFDEITQQGAFGTYQLVEYITPSYKKSVEDKEKANKEQIEKSNYLGEVGNKFKEKVKLVQEYSYKADNSYTGQEETKYIYTLETSEGNVLKWFTAVPKLWDIGQELYLSFIIKGFNEYKGQKQTMIKNVREVKEKH